MTIFSHVFDLTGVDFINLVVVVVLHKVQKGLFFFLNDSPSLLNSCSVKVSNMKESLFDVVFCYVFLRRRWIFSFVELCIS